jgi:hypothetical protein
MLLIYQRESEKEKFRNCLQKIKDGKEEKENNSNTRAARRGSERKAENAGSHLINPNNPNKAENAGSQRPGRGRAAR